ncbi:mitochondrial genome maintenance MGM101 [Coniophora puteana RWD-64-598 SS2]|uniref:Mitochondrial genome maintenance protein MGM101 n=1 Tax=Coniophora puteana (strain RWD-64-598) TaxID=741705 RepID=A0A5M3MCD7_CONPW|nr:mitochondrial genome maintenance MGM101 [Coniophora puteana RWD-64-598 SS2]EIW76311.1 mitochondrial genome maintenance MGM101 [Coniophora puteana RWD-64-598 SS2]
MLQPSFSLTTTRTVSVASGSSAPRSYNPGRATKTTKASASTAARRAPASADDVPSAKDVAEAASGSSIPAESVPSSAALGVESLLNEDAGTDWSKSYYGLSTQPFSKEIQEILLAPVDPYDIEVKPDGLIYLPEIKYRRVLNKAFGPGGWGLAPRSETNVGPKVVSREYALVCQGRLVAIARGEQEYFDPSGIATATEACKSNALMRCCKDLGVASELWDPRFIREFKAQHAAEVFAEHVNSKQKKKLWRRKDQPKLTYPWRE